MIFAKTFFAPEKGTQIRNYDPVKKLIKSFLNNIKTDLIFTQLQSSTTHFWVATEGQRSTALEKVALLRNQKNLEQVKESPHCLKTFF